MTDSKNLTVLRPASTRGLRTADIVGKTYSRLTIVSIAGTGDKGKIVNAICSCGSGQRLYPLYRLRCGKTKSCGCYRIEFVSRKRPTTPKDRILAKIFAQTITVGECRVWTGSTDVYGYGVMGQDGKRWRVSRLVYFLKFGELPTMACHSCDNPPCVNPDHLFNGTQKENMRDCSIKGRISNQFIKRREKFAQL